MGIRIKSKFEICLLLLLSTWSSSEGKEGDVQILLHVLTEWMNDVDSQWKARDCGKQLPSHWCLVNCKNRSSSSSRRLNAKLISVSASTTYVYNVASCKLTKRTLNWKLRTDGRTYERLTTTTRYRTGRNASLLLLSGLTQFDDQQPKQPANQPAADIKAHRT